MGARHRLGQMLATVRLRDPLNYVRFSITRPKWWLDERAHLQLLRQCFKPGELCFDVGANVGGFAESLMKLGARVVAIEPQPAAIEGFKTRHQGAIDESRIFLIEAGVGAAPGTIEMLSPEDGSEIGSMSREWIEKVHDSNRFGDVEWSRSITVRLTTLDLLIERFGIPAFCKIDVEGFEPEVLKGLSHPIRMVSFEYTPENVGHASSCIEQVSHNGHYQFNLACHQLNRLHFQNWLDPHAAAKVFEEEYGQHPALVGGGDIYCRLVS